MYTVIITGGIGSGKSTATEHLVSLGAEHISLDEVSHELLHSSPIARNKLVDAFGVGILSENGAIVPSLLANQAFASPQAQQTLNSIMFPLITQQLYSKLEGLKARPDHEVPGVVVIEVPLLCEAPQLVDIADEVIDIVAGKDVRIDRASLRMGDRASVEARDKLQATEEERLTLSDTVFENDGSVRALYDQIDRWWKNHEDAGWV